MRDNNGKVSYTMHLEAIHIKLDVLLSRLDPDKLFEINQMLIKEKPKVPRKPIRKVVERIDKIKKILSEYQGTKVIKQVDLANRLQTKPENIRRDFKNHPELKELLNEANYNAEIRRAQNKYNKN